MIEQVCHKLLTTSAAVTAKATGGAHYAERPQKYPLPAIVIQLVTAPRSHHLKGSTGRIVGVVRITTLARTYLDAKSLTASIINRLDGYSGTITVKNEEGVDVDVRVKYLMLDDEQPIPSDHRDGQGTIQTHGRQLDFRYSLTESIPTLT